MIHRRAADRPGCSTAVSNSFADDPLAFRFAEAVFHHPAESVVASSPRLPLTLNLTSRLQQHRHTCLASQNYVCVTKIVPAMVVATPERDDVNTFSRSNAMTEIYSKIGKIREALPSFSAGQSGEIGRDISDSF